MPRMDHREEIRAPTVHHAPNSKKTIKKCWKMGEELVYRLTGSYDFGNGREIESLTRRVSVERKLDVRGMPPGGEKGQRTYIYTYLDIYIYICVYISKKKMNKKKKKMKMIQEKKKKRRR